MAGFIKGEVVVIPFPFSDLSDSKRRPALVLADLPDNDILLCQITSRRAHDDLTVPLRIKDFSSGSLPIDSFIRPTRNFTADKNIIIRKAGRVHESVVKEAIDIIVNLITK
jgi:mRNA interferase MazF